jgi:hypothetical protein
MENGIDYQSMVEELRHNMTHSIVKFKYEKNNGIIREALGTLNPRIIEENDGELPKGTGEPKEGVLPYWDIESKGWRCFKHDNLICIEIYEPEELF